MNKIFGLDLGTKTLGIAISDALGIAAHPYEEFRFDFKNFKAAKEHVIEISKKEGIKEFVLGYPLNMDGTKGEKCESIERFRNELIAIDNTLTIHLVDERMTTIIATNRLLEADLSRAKRKQVIDKMSAVVILETYLNTKK